VYYIADAGYDYIDICASCLEQYQRNMDAFFQLYTGSRLRQWAKQKEDDE